MTNTTYNLLFLCTGNSARSIMAEALLRHWGKGRFNAYSAGSKPTGEVNPRAIELLQRLKMPTEGLRSKSWDEFAQSDSPRLDFVITVCDNAANEVCPVWPGQPVTAHWGAPDPAAVEGSEVDKSMAFREVFRILENRVKIFTSLRIEGLERLRIHEEMQSIGTLQPPQAQ
jgi:arsenate reductase